MQMCSRSLQNPNNSIRNIKISKYLKPYMALSTKSIPNKLKPAFKEAFPY